MSASVSGLLQGQDIVCLATQEWDAHWTPVQQVMARLAPANRVLYVEPFHAAISRLRNGNQVFQQQIRQGVPQLREVRPNLFVYRPGYPYLPLNMKLAASHSINSKLYSRELRSLLKKMSMDRPWLWAFFAQSLTALDIPFRHVIYDCVDDWPSFFMHSVERRYITQIDEELTRRADVVFVGSQPLYEKKKEHNARVYVVNHAADVPHFMKAADPATEVPADLAVVPEPRIGFVGMIDELRFDADLIAAVARNKHWNVVIAGGFIGGARELIPDLPNIHVLGMKKVDQLPAYLKGMNVCLMPYRVNETTKYIFPLKLFEYLASGKPVVATPIPAVKTVSDYVRIAATPAETVEAIGEALAETGTAASERRIKLAKGHSWESHVDQKLRHIVRTFGGG